MVSWNEFISRLKTDFRFSKQEIPGLVVAILVTGFVFSFRDWGIGQFELVTGLKNFLIVCFIVAITFFFRISAQKMYGLTEGHKPVFKVWWMGLVIALILAFISSGRIPLVLIGGTMTVLMVRHRLGEFRYGTSYWVNGMTAYFGPLANILLAILFGIGNYFMPGSYFFSKGLLLNIIMAICALIPIPQLEGLSIYMARRGLYYIAVASVILAAILLLSKTTIGLIVAIVIALIYGMIHKLIRSDV